MGAIGGMLGLNGGAGGSGFSTNAGTNADQLREAYSGVQGGLTGQQKLLEALQAQQGIQNQSQVYNQLQQVARGEGPNPAQAMLNQSTGANVANQAALMAGQRGAGANVGLMARQAGQQGANIQQQAAGQGASMQAQQALNAMGGAANMANTMAGQQIQGTQGLTEAQLANQQTLQGANSSHNTVQGGLAQTSMQGGQGLIGGILGGAGAAFGLADGGEVPNMGVQPTTPQGPQSKFAKFVTGFSDANTQPANSGAQAMQKGMTQFGKGLGSLLKSGPNTTPNYAGADVPMMADMAIAAKGGNVGTALKQGGNVPGAAKVKGDSYENDTVKAMLSPGEVVIPRSVMQSKDPARGAAQFVSAMMAKKGKRA